MKNYDNDRNMELEAHVGIYSSEIRNINIYFSRSVVIFSYRFSNNDSLIPTGFVYIFYVGWIKRNT